jgi:aspartyl-tRNA(Asn)/glutamyl-tRNA(Gln) amidotransferase subunit A
VNELAGSTATALLEGYRRRKFSPVEVVDALAARIEALDPHLGAFTTLCLDRAREEAHAYEQAYRRDEQMPPLAGVPFGVKDLFDSEGVRTTYGSPIFSDHVPAADAEAVRRARAAGAILVGKTQTHEFAWGITSVNTLLGTSRNPWAPDRISGGSSGGSAVALAAHLLPLALGSDTGGSIRVPSAFCGIVGLKPTYGRVSAAGVFPLARSLDHPGPMARTPDDAALLLSAIAGVDPADPATEDVPVGDPLASLDGGIEGLQVGLCPDLHLIPLAPDVQAAFDAATDALAGLGAELV